jgi:hypothetical protein
MIYEGNIKVKVFPPYCNYYSTGTALISRGINIAWRKAVARKNSKNRDG